MAELRNRREAFMDWTRIPYFLAVARAGSLRAAAEELAATHATVDRNLRWLEQEYGAQLFERTRQGLSLTAAGETLLPFAEEAELSLISARRKLQGRDSVLRGQVRLSIPTGLAFVILPELLAKFDKAYPEIELQVQVTNRIEDLSRAETDVSLRIAKSVDEDVVGRKVLQLTSNIFASRSYLDRHWGQSGPKGEGLQWVGWGDTAALPDWVKSSPFPKARLRYNLKSANLVAKMVEAGLGISYLPYFMVSALSDVVPVPNCEPFPDRSIWLLLHSDLRQAARVRALVDFLSVELRAQRAVFLGPLL